MQRAQRRQRDLRCADLEPGAMHCVELPRCQDCYDAGRQLHMHDPTRCAPFMPNTTRVSPVQRMPTIMDYDMLPDMGRMSARLP